MAEKTPKLKSTMMGMVLLDQSASIISCNDVAADMLGLKRDTLLGLSAENPCWGAVDFRGQPLRSDQHPDMVALRTGKSIKGFIMGVVKQDDQSTIWIEIESTPIFARGSEDMQPSGALTLFYEIDPPSEMCDPQTMLDLKRKTQQSLIKRLMDEGSTEANQLRIKTSQIATFLINLSAMNISKSHVGKRQNSLVLEVFLILMQLHSIDHMKPIPLKHVIHSSRFSSRRVMEQLHKMKEENLIQIDRIIKNNLQSREAYIHVNAKLHRMFISLVLDLSEIMWDKPRPQSGYNGMHLDWEKLLNEAGGGVTF